MTDILELTKQVQSDESYKSQEIIMLYPNELVKLEALLREKFIAELGEPVAYVHRNEYNEYRLEPMDTFKVESIPFNVDVSLYALPKDKDELK